MSSSNKEIIPCQEYFGKEHNLLRKAVRDFVKKEVLPNINDWEEACEFPREMYKKMADLGFLGIGFPEEVGGISGDNFLKIVATEELMRSGSGGFAAGIGSLDIALPPLSGTVQMPKRKNMPNPFLMEIKLLLLASPNRAVALMLLTLRQLP